MKKKAIIFSLLALLPLGASAQWAQIQHDDQKEKQWKSMENGPWDFAPDWYYYLFHNSYSGASLHWRWRGFHSGLYVEFDEDHSTSDETRYRGTFRWNEHYLFIVYMVKGDAIRIISARVATKGEIEHYYERR